MSQGKGEDGKGVGGRKQEIWRSWIFINTGTGIHHNRHWGHAHKALWQLGSGTTLQPRRVWHGTHNRMILDQKPLSLENSSSQPRDELMIPYEKIERQFSIQSKFFNSSDDLALDHDPLALKASWHWQLALTWASGSDNWLILATWWQLHHIGISELLDFKWFLLSWWNSHNWGLKQFHVELRKLQDRNESSFC